MGRQVRTAVAAVVAVTLLGACSTSVTGRAVRAPGSSGGPPATVNTPGVRARDLLLKSGDSVPFGAASQIPFGDNYFTRADPADCEAAAVVQDSPLLPPGATDRADSAYRFSGAQTYSESLGLYDAGFDDEHVVLHAFLNVAQCFVSAHRGFTAVSRDGKSWPVQLDGFDQSAHAMTWTLTQPNWICGFGLGSGPRVVLLVSACDAQPAFPMEDWLYKRLAQITGHPV